MRHATFYFCATCLTSTIILFSSWAWALQAAPTPSATSAPAINSKELTQAASALASKVPPFPIAGVSALGGRIFNIEPGIAIHSLAPFLQPGDEVRLLPGIHIPFLLADLHGTLEKPIVIRGYQTDTSKPLPYVKGELFSISLLRPQHVIVRDLLAGNTTGPTVFVDGSLAASPVVEETPLVANLNFINLQIKQESQSPNQSSIYLRSIEKVDLSNISIKGWNNSAVVMDNCKRVSVSKCTFDSAKNLPQYRGVAIRSGCEDISCMYVSFGIKVQVAFELGVCDTTNATEPVSQRPAQRILISHNAALECACFVSLGSLDNSSIINNSIIECAKYVFKADGACGVPNFINFENNLITWVPGRIELISKVAGGIPVESFRLGKNLWWSEELPAGFEIVGKPFGVELQPQLFDVNPNVEMRGFAPVNPKARAFGWSSSTIQMPPPGSKTPLQSESATQKPS